MSFLSFEPTFHNITDSLIHHEHYLELLPEEILNESETFSSHCTRSRPPPASATHMIEKSHSQQYSIGDASDGYSWPSSDRPGNDFQQFFEEGLNYLENECQQNGIPEGYAHASLSQIGSSDIGDFAPNQEVELAGQTSGPPYLSDSSLQEYYTHQPTQQYCFPPHIYHEPSTADAYPYLQSDAVYAAPTQWSGVSDNADTINNKKATQLHRPARPQRNVKARVGALLQEGQPKSKRAEKRAQVLEETGSVGACDNPKGITRIRPDGVLEWFSPEMSQWYAAAPLDDYRHQIISEDSALGGYVHEPKRGNRADDITSFPRNDSLGQHRWNLEDRNAWVDVRDHDGNQVLYLVDKPYRDIEIPDPGFMMYDNKIMLDPDDHPIIDWPGLPRCFSSDMEGARIEALRRIYPWISLPHFRARMPRWVNLKTGGVKKLGGLSSLQQRLSRFRESFDCPPWKKKHVVRGSDLAAHTKERLRKEGFNLRSTAELKPLTRKEVLQRKSPYAGKFPENAGIYTLTEEEREEKAANEAARHQEARAKRERAKRNAAVTGSPSGTKRKRDNATEADPSLGYVKKQARSVSRVSPKSAYGEAASRSATSWSDADIGPAEGAVNHKELSKEDFRWTVPRTVSEQLSIKAALSYTVADYKYYHAMEPPSTTAMFSYFGQYHQIQDHHKEAWTLEDVPAPQLIYLPGWYGSFQAVPPPHIDEESMKRLFPFDQEDTQIDGKATMEHRKADRHADAEMSSDPLFENFSDTDFSFPRDENA